VLHAGDATNWKVWAAAHDHKLTTKNGDRILGDYAIALDAALAGLGVALWIHELHGLPEGLVAFDEFPAPSPLACYLLSRTGDIDSPASGVAVRILVAGGVAGRRKRGQRKAVADARCFVSRTDDDCLVNWPDAT
jgi:DNA-binding transcriptional LysR family regulator